MKQIRFILYMIAAILLLSACSKKSDPLGRTCWECQTMPHAGAGLPTGTDVTICQEGDTPPTKYHTANAGYSVNNCKKK